MRGILQLDVYGILTLPLCNNSYTIVFTSLLTIVPHDVRPKSRLVIDGESTVSPYDCKIRVSSSEYQSLVLYIKSSLVPCLIKRSILGEVHACRL